MSVGRQSQIRTVVVVNFMQKWYMTNYETAAAAVGLKLRKAHTHALRVRRYYYTSLSIYHRRLFLRHSARSCSWEPRALNCASKKVKLELQN